MHLISTIKQLCGPSKLYLIVSLIWLISLIFTNMNSHNSICYGTGTIHCPYKIIMYVIKLLIIIFWTWILNLMCRSGHKGIAWLFILLPFILGFFVVFLVSIQ